MIAASVKKMNELGADYIVMPCGTAHAFLPDVYQIVPECKNGRVLNIIEILRDHLTSESVSEILIIAAEGTLKQRIYPQCLEPVECVNPDEKYYAQIRYFIESVKQNFLNEDVFKRFIAFLKIFGCHDVVLGCTEFPVLVNALKQSGFSEDIEEYCFWDPLTLTINKLKEIMK